MNQEHGQICKQQHQQKLTKIVAQCCRSSEQYGAEEKKQYRCNERPIKTRLSMIILIKREQNKEPKLAAGI